MHYALVSRCFEVFVNKGKKINKFNKSKSSAMVDGHISIFLVLCYFAND